MEKERSSSGGTRSSADESSTTSRQRGQDTTGESDESSGEASRGVALPELLRRAMALGFSSFFTTEEAIRKALGDTLPQDWVDFATDQSQRTRSEFMERLAHEFGQVIEKIDVAQVLEQLLAEHTLEITAHIRLERRNPDDSEQGKRSTVKLSIREEKNDS